LQFSGLRMRNFTWNRFPIKNLLIDSLLTPFVESTYLVWLFISKGVWQPYIPLSKMLQYNVVQLSKLLLTGYQFSSVRIPIEYGGRVKRCSINSFVTAGLWSRSGYPGGCVSETKGNALAKARPR